MKPSPAKTPRFLILLWLGLNAGAVAWAQGEAIDYEKLDLSITMSRLRSGNHDPSGDNQYYFHTKLYALPILKDEIKKSFEERVKIERSQGEFAALTIKALKHWQMGKKPDPKHSLSVSGDVVREMVAEAMRVYQVPEDQVALLIKTQMLERNKKFKFIGEDLLVGEVDHYLIPETLPRAPSLQDTELTIKDNLGTSVGLSLHFKANQADTKP